MNNLSPEVFVEEWLGIDQTHDNKVKLSIGYEDLLAMLDEFGDMSIKQHMQDLEAQKE